MTKLRGEGNAVRQEPWEKWRVSERNMRSSREKPQEIVAGLAFVREFGRNFGGKFEMRANLPTEMGREIETRDRFYSSYTTLFLKHLSSRFKDSGILWPGRTLSPVLRRLEILSSANFYAKRGLRWERNAKGVVSVGKHTRPNYNSRGKRTRLYLVLIPFDLYSLFLPCPPLPLLSSLSLSLPTILNAAFCWISFPISSNIQSHEFSSRKYTYIPKRQVSNKRRNEQPSPIPP